MQKNKVGSKLGEMIGNGQYEEVKMDWGIPPKSIKDQVATGLVVALALIVTAFLVACLWQGTLAGDCQMGMGSQESCDLARDAYGVLKYILFQQF